MKRRSSVAAIPTHSLLDFDLGESSSDSDFRIEDHDEESDSSVNSDKSDNDSDDNSDDSDDDEDDDEDSDNEFNVFKNSFSESPAPGQDLTAAQVLAQAKAKDAMERANAKMLATPVCCACLGDRSDDTNEIVECDNCGISVHEGCYGISDSNSVSSTVSSCSTEPWFCEACKANVVDPSCELCPNKGGIFKETDVGKWVHLVCALYVPGVAFGEVDHLSSVTLFEMPYNKWGAKICSLCDDARFARCGVCIGCDAGMCKTYFHVTCAQAAGLLSETHSEEADHADPFYAHCKIHSDKTLIKHRKRNFMALKMKMEYRKMSSEQKKPENSSPGQQRIERKLKKHRNKYVAYKAQKMEPWVPTQKMPRLLSTSASACRRLILKAELMGIDAAALEFQEAQMASLADVRKKWHIPPAFSVEFIGYYLDRISRTKEIKSSLQHQLQLNKTLVNDQKVLRNKYDEAIKVHTEASVLKTSLTEAIERLHLTIHALCPNKTIPQLEIIGQTSTIVAPPVAAQPVTRPMSVPTAAALKMGVGFPLTNLPGTKEDPNRVLSTQCQNKSDLLYECGICKHVNDQHLLAKCDTCHLHYHLGCLTPPLTRHPKKSKIYGWQCSECDEDNPDGVVPLTSGPRKSRTKYSKDGTIVPVDSSNDVSLDNVKEDEKVLSTSPIMTESAKKQKPTTSNSNKKSNKKSSKNVDELATTEKTVNNHFNEQTIASPKSPESNFTLKSPKRNASVKSPEPVSKSPAVLEVSERSKSPKRKDAKKKETPKSKAGKAAPLEPAEPTPNSVNVIENGSAVSSTTTTEPAETKTKIKLNGNEKSSPTKPLVSKSTPSSPVAESMPEMNSSPKPQPPAPKVRISKKSKKLHVAKLRTEHSETNGDTVPSLSISLKSQVPPTPMEVADVISPDVEAQSQNNDLKSPATEPAPLTNGIKSRDENDATHKQNRKRRKEKRRSKHGLGRERSLSKEHKKKRKRKNHDNEHPNSMPNTADGVPKIKIKFKALPLPGETATEPHCFYVPANMVRPRDFSRSRPASVDSNDENTSTSVPHGTPTRVLSPTTASQSPTRSIMRTRRISVLLSPPRSSARQAITPTNIPNITITNDVVESQVCDVCQESGTNQDLVKCDECRKNYHFRCLDPPLKKTPKRRGYSWHCADCDPTDKEDH